MSLLPQLAGGEPRPGATYPLAFNDTRIRLVFGFALAISMFILVVPLVTQAIVGASYAIRGRPGEFPDYYADAMGYQYLEGVVASHLSLGLLIVISLLAARYLHGRRARWMWSVQPGMRWRYLFVCLLVGAVVLNAVLWVSWVVVEMPAFQPAEPGWAWFAVVLLFTSPLQATAEEVFFRGYLLQALGSATGRAWLGIVGSALVFALFHGVQNPALFANRFAFGVLAGWLVWKTGGLEAAIGVHVANNLFAFGYGIVTGGIAATRATTAIGWDRAVFDVAGFALFAAVAWWIARRMNVATTSV